MRACQTGKEAGCNVLTDASTTSELGEVASLTIDHVVTQTIERTKVVAM